MYVKREKAGLYRIAAILMAVLMLTALVAQDTAFAGDVTPPADDQNEIASEDTQLVGEEEGTDETTPILVDEPDEPSETPDDVVDEADNPPIGAVDKALK